MTDVLDKIHNYDEEKEKYKNHPEELVKDLAIVKTFYFDPRTGFLGKEDLFHKLQVEHPSIPMAVVSKFFRENTGVQITHQIPHTHNFLPIYAAEETQPSFQMDLAFLHKYESVNKGFKVLLTCININSRYAYAYKSKNKTATSILEMMHAFIRDATAQDHEPPKTITTDRGSEFIASSYKELLAEHHITHWMADVADHHIMAKIERFNRTLKGKLALTFDPSLGAIWYDKVEDIVYNYNHTTHSATGVVPALYTKEDDINQLAFQRGRTEKIRSLYMNLRVGDAVRIAEKKTLFNKGVGTWSEDIYLIDKVNPDLSYELRHNNSDVTVNDRVLYNQKGHVILDSQGLTKTFKSTDLKKISKASIVLHDGFPSGFQAVRVNKIKKTEQEHSAKLRNRRENADPVSEKMVPVHKVIEVTEQRRSTRVTKAIDRHT